MSTDLVSKYNIPAPRYTSYPTVPYWDDNVTQNSWMEHVKGAFKKFNKDGISIYIHLPYCESLCTYCACNTRITVNHNVEVPYINALLKEWQLYLAQFESRPKIKEIHLGGGTPTFFSAQNLKQLISTILNTCDLHEQHDLSFEGHPSNTTPLHLQTLYDLGFRRVSFGVQDFDEKVQDTINRYQTFEEVSSVVNTARSIGYSSVNIDLVYGLPYQTVESVRTTVKKIIELKPERIAFYSYAHVPWLKPGQRKYTEKELPIDSIKRALYTTGKNLFAEASYTDIGMDHFSLPGDELLNSYNNGTLHRNFMGYTTNNTKLLIGLGCSSISDTWNAFSQNIKTVEEYRQAVDEGKFPLQKGHILTKEDLNLRQHILNLMCKHESDFSTNAIDQSIFNQNAPRLTDFVNDGLIVLDGQKITLTDLGKLFIRNICLAFDARYWSKSKMENVFSTTA